MSAIACVRNNRHGWMTKNRYCGVIGEELLDADGARCVVLADGYCEVIGYYEVIEEMTERERASKPEQGAA